MTCDKCGSIIKSGTKCLNCGHDNQNVGMPSRKFLDKVSSSSAYYRSTRLTVFMILFIAINIIVISLTAYGLTNFTEGERPLESVIILAVISIVVSVLDIVLCIFILRLKKWAFNSYIVLNIINGVVRIVAYFDVFSVILRALLLYFIFRNDLEYFE